MKGLESVQMKLGTQLVVEGAPGLQRDSLVRYRGYLCNLFNDKGYFGYFCRHERSRNKKHADVLEDHPPALLDILPLCLLW